MSILEKHITTSNTKSWLIHRTMNLRCYKKHLIHFLKDKRKLWSRWDMTYMKNQTFSHQNTLRENSKLGFIHMIKVLKNRKKNWYSSRKNTMMNWESFHQDPFKTRCLPWTLNIHILQITMKNKSRLRFFHLIKVLKTGIRIDRV